MSEYLPTILFMAVLLALSAYFSATETAFSSMNRTRLKNMAEDGDKKAEEAFRLSEDYDRLLSTLLIGNNVVNIGLASLGTVLFVRRFGDDLGSSLSTLVITVLVLIFGEISPKSLAKDNPENFAKAVAPSVRVLIAILRPVNFLFAQWKHLLSRIFHVSSDRKLTHSELLTLVEEVEQDGGIDKNEGDLLRNAIEFNELDAADILTPRVDIVGVEIDDSAEEIARQFTESGFSRLPVYRDSIDRIIGIIYQKDFYAAPRLHEDRPAADIMRQPLFITPSTKLSDLLHTLQKTKSHLAVVADEYGGTMGIVTMEDILEELVGEIWDEHDEVVEDFEKTGPDTYRVLCSAEMHKMLDYFNIRGDVDTATVSGWVMESLGHFPDVGDSFEYDGLHITVTKTDRQRILEIEIKVLPQEENEQSAAR